MAHEIRLAGPWEMSAVGRGTVRCQLPFDSEQHSVQDGFTLQRKFHRPSGLESTDKLQIVITANQPLHNMRLNDNPIAAASTSQNQSLPSSVFDIKDHIQEFNLLEILAVTDEPFPSRIETVVLRIETTA